MRRYFTMASLAAALLLAATPGFAGWEEGLTAFKAGNYSEAAREFKALAEEQPEVMQYQMMLGQTYLALGRSADAVNHLRKAYDLNPGDNSIRLPLATAYVQAGRHRDGLQLLKTIDPDTLSAQRKQAYFQLRAKALEDSGDVGALLEDFRAAVRSNPNSAVAQYNLGRACLSARETDCAVSALEAAVRLDKADPAKKKSLVKAYLLQGRSSQGTSKRNAYTKAARAGRDLVAASSSYANLVLYGEAQLGAKDYSGAVQTFDRATKADASDWLPLYYKGQAQTSLGRFDAAESTLKSALGKTSSSTDQSRIWRQLGFVYEKQKSYEAAIAAYRQIGDTQAVNRVEENRRIAMENLEVEEYNREIEELEKERERLEEEMSELPPDLR